MPVSFERIPSNIRVPLFYAEISAREAAYFQLLQPSLLIGPMLDEGAATPLEPVLVTDFSQAAGLFGAGSVLADMAGFYRRNDSVGTLWCIQHTVPGNATAAQLSDTIERTAASAGMAAVYLGGDRYAVTIAQGDTGPVIAERLAALINGDAFSLVTAEAPAASESTGIAATISYTTKARGTIGNEIMRTWNWRGITGGEITPHGITITGEGDGDLTGQLAGGAGVPDMAAIVNAMGDDE